MGENIYMLPSDMNLNIKTGTSRYNNKILISNGKFSLGKNDKVNADGIGSAKISHKDSKTTKIKSHKDSKVVTQTAAIHKDSNVVFKNLAQKPTITHEEEKIALILSLTGTFTIWYMF